MARLVFDGKHHIYWLPANPADLDAPTVAEIAAGDEITSFIPKDGVQYGISNNRVDGGDISTIFGGESMGTWTSQVSLTIFLDDDTNTAFDLLGAHGVSGCLVITPFEAAAATAKCYVFPTAETGAPVLGNSAANERQKATIELAIGSEPQFDGVVAA